MTSILVVRPRWDIFARLGLARAAGMSLDRFDLPITAVPREENARQGYIARVALLMTGVPVGLNLNSGIVL